MKQPTPFTSYLLALLVLIPLFAQANPTPTAPKPTPPITANPATSLSSAKPFLPHIPQIGPDGRLIIPTAPLLPRYPTHYQDFFKKHKAYEYGAGLSLQEIGRIAQSKGYTLYSNRAFNEIASVLSPAPLWPEWAEKIRAVQRIDEGSIDIAGHLSKTGPQSKGDYLGYAYFGVIDKNNREGKQQTVFDAIYPEINRHNQTADLVEQSISDALNRHAPIPKKTTTPQPNQPTPLIPNQPPVPDSRNDYIRQQQLAARSQGVTAVRNFLTQYGTDYPGFSNDDLSQIGMGMDPGALITSRGYSYWLKPFGSESESDNDLPDWAKRLAEHEKKSWNDYAQKSKKNIDDLTDPWNDKKSVTQNVAKKFESSAKFVNDSVDYAGEATGINHVVNEYTPQFIQDGQDKARQWARDGIYGIAGNDPDRLAVAAAVDAAVDVVADSRMPSKGSKAAHGSRKHNGGEGTGANNSRRSRNNSGSGNGGGGRRSGNGDGGNNGNGGGRNGGHGNGGGGNSGGNNHNNGGGNGNHGNPPDGGHGGKGSGKFPDGTYKRKPNDPYTPRKYDPARPDVSKKPDAPIPHKPDVSKTPDGNNNNRTDSDKKISVDKTPDLKKPDASTPNYPVPEISQASSDVVADYQRRVDDLRNEFSHSDIRDNGNVAIADIDINGINMDSIAAHSRIHEQNKGFSGDGKTEFDSLELSSVGNDGIPRKPYDRKVDAEYQIFSNISDKLGNNYQAKGTIRIYSEKEVCLSCSNVAQQFKARYPNIVIQMIDGTGKILIY